MVGAAQEALGDESPTVAWASVDLGQRLEELEEHDRALKAYTQAMGELDDMVGATGGREEDWDV
jgi:hypothetical protein